MLKSKSQKTATKAAHPKEAYSKDGRSSASRTHLVYSIQGEDRQVTHSPVKEKPLNNQTNHSSSAQRPFLRYSATKPHHLMTDNRDNEKKRKGGMATKHSVQSAGRSDGKKVPLSAHLKRLGQTTYHANQTRQVQLSGILSDNERKKVKPKGTIAWDQSTKHGADTGSKESHRSKVSKQDGIVIQQSADPSDDSVIERMGDMGPEKKDTDFSKVSKQCKNENYFAKFSKPAPNMRLEDAVGTTAGTNDDLATIVSRNDQNSKSGDIKKTKEGDTTDCSKRVEIYIHSEKESEEQSSIAAQESATVKNDISHVQMFSQDSLTRLQTLRKEARSLSTFAKPTPSMQMQKSPRVRLAHQNQERLSLHLVQGQMDYQRPDRGAFSPDQHKQIPIVVSQRDDGMLTSRNAQYNSNYGDLSLGGARFLSGSQRILSGPLSNYSTAQRAQEKIKTPKTGTAARERVVAHYDELREQNTDQFDSKEISGNVFVKRNERILKEKQFALETFDQKERNREYKKQMKQSRKDNKYCLTSIKPSATSMFSPQVTSATKRSDIKRNEKLKSLTDVKEKTGYYDSVGKEKKSGLHFQESRDLSKVQSMQSLRSNLNLRQQQQEYLTSVNSSSCQLAQHGDLALRLSTTINLKRNGRETTTGGGGGSSLFKTADSKNALFKQNDLSTVGGHTIGLSTQLASAMNQMTILSMDKPTMSQFQQLKRTVTKGSSQKPTASIKEDLEDNYVNFKIGEKANPAGLRRKVQHSREDSSLPTQLTMRDKNGATNVRVLDKPAAKATRKANKNQDAGAQSDDETDIKNGKRVLKLSKATNKQNKFLDKFGHLCDSVTNRLKHSQSATQLPNLNNINDMPASIVAGGAENMYQTHLGSSRDKSRSLAYPSFESQLNAITQSGQKQPGNINSAILRQLSKPEVVDYPDYPKVALQATQTETKTMLYELKRLMNSNAMILNLESIGSAHDAVKNENIELIPRLPIQCRVSIKERVAPLKLRFDFYDLQTKERIKNPDVVVCLSPTLQNPTLETAQTIKTEFKVPSVWMFREYNGKMIPEFNPINKKDKFPQQVYLSLESMTGCTCTISVSFPYEEKHKKALQNLNPKQLTKQRTSTGQMSKEEERYEELQTIISMKKISSGQSYELKKRFIYEEVQKIGDNQGYICQAMKVADEKRLEKKNERSEQRKVNDIIRSENEKISIRNFIERHQKMCLEASMNKTIDYPLAQMDGEVILERMKSISDENLDPRELDELRRQRQQFKREIMSKQASEMRRSQTEEKQKMRLLYLLKQDLLKTYRQNEYAKYNEYRQRQEAVKQWIVFGRTWSIFAEIATTFKKRALEDKIRREKYRMAHFAAIYAKRVLFSNFGYGSRGKTIAQRMVRYLKHSNQVVATVQHPLLENKAKGVMLHFLRAIATRHQLESSIRKLIKAVQIVKRSWNRYRFTFVVRQAIMKHKMEQAKQGQWFKEANNKKNKFVQPIDRKEYIRNSMRIYENEDLEEITVRNLKLFSQMIKYEGLINSFQVRIEKKVIAAKACLMQIQKEEDYLALITKDDADVVDVAVAIAEDSSYLDSTNNESFDVAVRREELKKEQHEVLEQMERWRKSSFLRVVEHKYHEIVRQVSHLEQDRCNYAVFVWKGLDGYEKIIQAAHNFKTKGKSQTSKINKKDKHSTNYRKGQADTVSHAFTKWMQRRKREFNETLAEAVQRQDFSIMPTGRFTQPEETAFMFLKIMEDIHVWFDHQDRVKKHLQGT